MFPSACDNPVYGNHIQGCTRWQFPNLHLRVIAISKFRFAVCGGNQFQVGRQPFSRQCVCNHLQVFFKASLSICVKNTPKTSLVSKPFRTLLPCSGMHYHKQSGKPTPWWSLTDVWKSTCSVNDLAVCIFLFYYYDLLSISPNPPDPPLPHTECSSVLFVKAVRYFGVFSAVPSSYFCVFSAIPSPPTDPLSFIASI